MRKVKHNRGGPQNDNDAEARAEQKLGPNAVAAVGKRRPGEHDKKERQYQAFEVGPFGRLCRFAHSLDLPETETARATRPAWMDARPSSIKKALAVKYSENTAGDPIGA